MVGDVSDVPGLQIERSTVKTWSTFYQDILSFLVSPAGEEMQEVELGMKHLCKEPQRPFKDKSSAIFYRHMLWYVTRITKFTDIISQADLVYRDSNGSERTLPADFVYQKKKRGRKVDMIPVKFFSMKVITPKHPEFAIQLPEIWKEVNDHDEAVFQRLKDIVDRDLREEELNKLKEKMVELDRKRCLKNYLTTTHTYMVVAGAKYGVMSSFEQNWFFRRVLQEDGSEELLISPPIVADEIAVPGKPKLLDCFIYLDYLTKGNNGLLDLTEAHRAALEEFNYVPRPQIASDGDEDSSYLRLHLTAKELKLGWLLHANETARLYLAKWKGELVVVKMSSIFDFTENTDFLNEVLVYQQLSEIQGTFIPRLKFYGTWNKSVMLVALEFTNGTDAARCGRKLTKKEKDHLQLAVDEIHRRGISHNNLQLSNVIVHPDPSQMPLLIDFASAGSHRGVTTRCWNKDKVKQLLRSL